MKIPSRIQQLFADEKARVAYLTVGDGGRDRTLDAAIALIKGGVNMLELGMPFSDPIADGPVIERAAKRALENGTTLQDVLWLVKAIRKQSDVPLILFSYLNPILAVMKLGLDFNLSASLNSNFMADLKEAGLDGLLLVDCPLEELKIFDDASQKACLDLIYVITSNTPLDRIKKISGPARGFIYYVCHKGTTGMRDHLPCDFKKKIKTIKSVVELPIVVGFGLSNAKMVEEVLEVADGAVIGSYFVKLLEENVSPHELSRYAREIYDA